MSILSQLIFYFALSHVLSFLCSILEAVLFTCNMSYIENLKRQQRKSGQILDRLKHEIDRPLAAILSINTCSHTFGAVGVGASVLALFGSHFVTLGSVVLTLTMLYWTEMIPKTLGALYWRELAPACAHVIQVMIWITYPFVYSFNVCGRLMTKKRKHQLTITQEDIRGALASGAQAGVIAPAEQEMVENIFRLADRNIGVLMVPRVDLQWIDVEDGAEEQRRLILEQKQERYLLCRGEIDRVIGVIDTKNLLQAVWENQHIDLKGFAHPVQFVHENQKVFELMELFEKTQSQMALVTDEYGVIQGVVTMNEVLEAIIKDIDQQGTAYYHQLNSRSWILNGKMPIDEFKEIFMFSSLPDEERARYRTLGGLCMTLLGAIPKKGDFFILEAYRLEITRVHRRRVEKILMTHKV